jgi:hypothetical protein
VLIRSPVRERVVSDDYDLIGREDEQAALDQALAATHDGTGGILLLAGGAGVGKTRLLEACLPRSGLLALKGQSNEIATPPYGPLAPYLALLLPELGPPPQQTDPAVLVEAVCQAFAAIARTVPAVLVLDDQPELTHGQPLWLREHPAVLCLCGTRAGPQAGGGLDLRRRVAAGIRADSAGALRGDLRPPAQATTADRETAPLQNTIRFAAAGDLGAR